VTLRGLLSKETPARLALRAVLLVAPVLALLAARPQDVPSGWFVALTTVLSIGFAAMPESALGTTCLGVVAFWWAIASSHGVPAGAVPAALLLVAAHVASVLLSYGPASMPIGPALSRLWLRRGLAVSVVAPLVWLVAVAVDDEPEPPGIWVSGLACAVVLCIVAATAVAVHEDDR
jgi:hypothetical protein